jgi:hypothetical protein
MKITQRSLGRAVSRVVPIAGALGVGAYTWYDTRQVARTALELFGRESAAAPAAPRKRPGTRRTGAKKAPTERA